MSGVPCPPPEDLPNSRIKPVSPVTPALQADSLLQSHQRSPKSSLTALKILHALPATPGNYWSFYCLHRFTFSKMLYHIIEVIQYLALSHWLISLKNTHLMFVSFQCLVLHNIPLSWCIILYLSIQFLQGIMIASILWQCWIKLPKTSVNKLLCGHKFSTPVGKY